MNAKPRLLSVEMLPELIERELDGSSTEDARWLFSQTR
jgi:hypothetical protein